MKVNSHDFETNNQRHFDPSLGILGREVAFGDEVFSALLPDSGQVKDNRRKKGMFFFV
ncbi:hypothetical protein [Coleofasciculus sp.]|uniref:hypothetical protein n=1 Tax=Coleofasciculus sp. TaxID=3100458 RepID=UPI0039F78ADF